MLVAWLVSLKQMYVCIYDKGYRNGQVVFDYPLTGSYFDNR